MYMMESQKVSLESLYDYIALFRQEMQQRFDLNDKRLEYLEGKMDSNFQLINQRFVNLETKVQEIYESRDKVKFEFNRKVLFGTGLFAGIIAFFVALVTGRYTQ
ncbi:hypothetical protein HY604_04550 [Candidatus Peregrinibacteria bacterium]|nr:hypothetical protein [Candidatus Peregrinibacteria bacterium]